MRKLNIFDLTAKDITETLNWGDKVNFNDSNTGIDRWTVTISDEKRVELAAFYEPGKIAAITISKMDNIHNYSLRTYDLFDSNSNDWNYLFREAGINKDMNTLELSQLLRQKYAKEMD